MQLNQLQASFRVGDHVLVPGELAPFHELIWLGEGCFNINGSLMQLPPNSVVHVWSDTGSKRDASVQITSIKVCRYWRQAAWLRYADDPRVEEVRHHRPINAVNLKTSSNDTVLDRAFSHLGWYHYDLFNANCGHFATWCKTGLPISLQLERHPLTRRIHGLFIKLPQYSRHEEILLS